MSDVRMTLMEAIARKRAIIARYNGEDVRLAPHLLFERHGELFVCALNMSKTWRSDDERKLGQFKLAGLTEPRLLDDDFDPLPGFAPTTPRADDTLILAL